MKTSTKNVSIPDDYYRPREIEPEYFAYDGTSKIRKAFRVAACVLLCLVVGACTALLAGCHDEDDHVTKSDAEANAAAIVAAIDGVRDEVGEEGNQTQDRLDLIAANQHDHDHEETNALTIVSGQLDIPMLGETASDADTQWSPTLNEFYAPPQTEWAKFYGRCGFEVCLLPGPSGGLTTFILPPIDQTSPCIYEGPFIRYGTGVCP